MYLWPSASSISTSNIVQSQEPMYEATSMDINCEAYYAATAAVTMCFPRLIASLGYSMCCRIDAGPSKVASLRRNEQAFSIR